MGQTWEPPPCTLQRRWILHFTALHRDSRSRSCAGSSDLVARLWVGPAFPTSYPISWLSALLPPTGRRQPLQPRARHHCTVRMPAWDAGAQGLNLFRLRPKWKAMCFEAGALLRQSMHHRGKNIEFLLFSHYRGFAAKRDLAFSLHRLSLISLF